MNDQDIKETAKNIIDEKPVGIMATIKQNKPHSRYMTFYRDGLTLYSATSNETDKAHEIENNPYTHIILGYEGDGFGDGYVEYEGKVSIKDHSELKEKLWDDYMKKWFSGPDDENYIILEISPENVRLMNKQGAEPQTISL